MKKLRITCDNCNFDLTYTQHKGEYYIHMENSEKIISKISATSLVELPKHILDDLHFCNLPCLAFWLEKKREMLLDQYQKIARHRARLDEQQREFNARRRELFKEKEMK